MIQPKTASDHLNLVSAKKVNIEHYLNIEYYLYSAFLT